MRHQVHLYFCNQYLQKGRPVLIEGRLKFDTWEDGEGNRRSKHYISADRVTFLGTGLSTFDDSIQDNKSQSLSTPFTESSTTDELKKTIEGVLETPEGEGYSEKSKNKSKKKESSPSGEIDFKSEKPFEDELPF